MYWHLVAMATGSALVAGLITWAVARRYGRWHALAVPLLALMATGYMIWRSGGMNSHDALGAVAAAFVFTGPSVAGALLALMLARAQRR